MAYDDGVAEPATKTSTLDTLAQKIQANNDAISELAERLTKIAETLFGVNVKPLASSSTTAKLDSRDGRIHKILSSVSDANVQLANIWDTIRRLEQDIGL